MIVIGICDGDSAVRVMLSDYIHRYREETGELIQVLSYDNGDKLLRHYPLEMDLIFLEIPFIKMNGIEIAKRIRVIDPNVSIIFLTTVLSYVLEAYDVKAKNYLIKPLPYLRFLKEIEDVKSRNHSHRFFLETNINGLFKVYTKSIVYIETEEHNTCIHTEQSLITSYKRMKDHEQYLFESYFIRCHTSFIVNLLYFERLEGSDILLSSGIHIPVSRNRRTKVLERIQTLYQKEVNHEKI